MVINLWYKYSIPISTVNFDVAWYLQCVEWSQIHQLVSTVEILPGLDLSLTDRGRSCSKYLRRNWKLKNYLETKLRGSFNFLNSDLVDWIETGEVLETRLESFHNFTQHCRWSNHLLLFQVLNLPQLWCWKGGWFVQYMSLVWTKLLSCITGDHVWLIWCSFTAICNITILIINISLWLEKDWISLCKR